MPAKILICDDDEGILDLLTLVFTDAGYDTVAEIKSLNVAAAINREKPDLLILDLWMPVLSGDQVLRALRNGLHTKDLPVIVISASSDGLPIAMNAGATDFLAKPFDLNDLLQRTKNLLETY